MDQRSKLWYKHKKSKSKQEKEKIKEQINNLNKEINPLRKEVVLCKDIIERSKKMEQNLQFFSSIFFGSTFLILSALNFILGIWLGFSSDKISSISSVVSVPS